MKKIIIAALACIFTLSVAYAAQNSAATIRQVRDPVQLKALLDSNASDAQTRIAAIEAIDGGGGALAPGYIIVGNASTVSAAVAVSGDIGISTSGVVSITSGAIVNADVNTNAAIVSTKLSGLALTDTNTTVNTTINTPLFAGQVLVGTVSNKVWVSKGVTTNDWVSVN